MHLPYINLDRPVPQNPQELVTENKVWTYFAGKMSPRGLNTELSLNIFLEP